jgi:hypothetical protein
MLVYRFLRCLCVMCVVALLTFWGARGVCVFSPVLSCIFYGVLVEYIRFYNPLNVIYVLVLHFAHFWVIMQQGVATD